jgi:hypothetical protein
MEERSVIGKVRAIAGQGVAGDLGLRDFKHALLCFSL